MTPVGGGLVTFMTKTIPRRHKTTVLRLIPSKREELRRYPTDDVPTAPTQERKLAMADCPRA